MNSVKKILKTKFILKNYKENIIITFSLKMKIVKSDNCFHNKQYISPFSILLEKQSYTSAI